MQNLNKKDKLEFKRLRRHIGHNIACVKYGKGKQVANISIECEDCFEVLLSIDKPNEKHTIKNKTRR